MNDTMTDQFKRKKDKKDGEGDPNTIKVTPKRRKMEAASVNHRGRSKQNSSMTLSNDGRHNWQISIDNS